MSWRRFSRAEDPVRDAKHRLRRRELGELDGVTAVSDPDDLPADDPDTKPPRLDELDDPVLTNVYNRLDIALRRPRSREELDQHLQTPMLTNFWARRLDLLEKDVEIRFIMMLSELE